MCWAMPIATLFKLATNSDVGESFMDASTVPDNSYIFHMYSFFTFPLILWSDEEP